MLRDRGRPSISAFLVTRYRPGAMEWQTVVLLVTARAFLVLPASAPHHAGWCASAACIAKVSHRDEQCLVGGAGTDQAGNGGGHGCRRAWSAPCLGLLALLFLGLCRGTVLRRRPSDRPPSRIPPRIRTSMADGFRLARSAICRACALTCSKIVDPIARSLTMSENARSKSSSPYTDTR